MNFFLPFHSFFVSFFSCVWSCGRFCSAYTLHSVSPQKCDTQNEISAQKKSNNFSNFFLSNRNFQNTYMVFFWRWRNQPKKVRKCLFQKRHQNILYPKEEIDESLCARHRRWHCCYYFINVLKMFWLENNSIFNSWQFLSVFAVAIVIKEMKCNQNIGLFIFDIKQKKYTLCDSKLFNRNKRMNGWFRYWCVALWFDRFAYLI